MFKNVEYAGFERWPDLEAKARSATDVLGGVIHDWKADVVVTWSPSTQPDSGLELALTLVLPDATVEAVGRISDRGFEPGERSRLRMDLRDVWLDVLDHLIAQVATRVEESIDAPVGV